MKFNSRISYGPKCNEYSQLEIKNEPMLFGASVDFAEANGGPITKDFIYQLMDCGSGQVDNKTMEEWLNELVIDSRVHMLMRGWYPCIPGWHHDDVPRTRSDKQPNYRTPKYKSQHAMAIFGDVSLPEFIQGEVNLEIPKVGKTIYKEWNKKINKSLGLYRILRMQPNSVLYFDWNSFHRGTPATHNGWRMFIRASWNTNRKVVNEVRKQVNVYMDVADVGW